jgi:phytoene dehydrogenase-like protein
MTTMRDQLDAIEPGSFKGLERYMEAGARHYRVVAEKMVNRDFRWPIDYLGSGPGSARAWQPACEPLPRDVGLLRRAAPKERVHVPGPLRRPEPIRGAGHLSLLSYTELAHGVWYPAGGMYSIVETLVDLARDAGVEFTFGSNVSGSTPRRTGLGVCSWRTGPG